MCIFHFFSLIYANNTFQQTIYALGLDKDADPQQVKVHTCDSISQIKEKILDTIYRTTPYSHRPPKEELDLGKYTNDGISENHL